MSYLNKSIYIWLIVIVSFIGIIDTGYLSIKYFRGQTIQCSLLDGCESVTNSIYATIGFVPIAFLGLIFYIIVFLSIMKYIRSSNVLVLRLLRVFTFMGILVSAVLVFLQVFVIEALCLYCMISAINTLLLFIFAILLKD